MLGMAVLDEVRLMTKAGRQTEARASLERQAGQFDDCPVGIIMYGDLSALYFADGDIAAAERHARTAQRLFEAHSRPESCADSMDTSRFILDRIAEAAKTPVAVALLSGDVVERGEHRDYRQVYRLTALRPVDVAVTTTATGLAWGFDGPWERTWGQCTRELRLTLADYRSPDAAWAEIRCDGMAPLTVRVPRKRNFGDPP